MCSEADFMICGRTDLRIGTVLYIKNKSDARLDFEIHLAEAAQKPLNNFEKLIFRNYQNSFLYLFGIGK